ncbi:unnamed protein product [Ambrosiozyma monospora]|uniref:Unnamed protein product n=1 Tax=Ambrosiozyma monospora TaxID=43982 RepID=A0A9W6SY79_AMBMO|nr:unnamed protein product [Ambrosiozyma monospora]
MLLYTIAVFGGHTGVETAAGVFAFLASATAFYGVYDGLVSAADSYAPLPESKFLRMPGSWKKPTNANRVALV